MPLKQSKNYVEFQNIIDPAFLIIMINCKWRSNYENTEKMIWRPMKLLYRTLREAGISSISALVHYAGWCYFSKSSGSVYFPLFCYLQWLMLLLHLPSQPQKMLSQDVQPHGPSGSTKTDYSFYSANNYHQYTSLFVRCSVAAAEQLLT